MQEHANRFFEGDLYAGYRADDKTVAPANLPKDYQNQRGRRNNEMRKPMSGRNKVLLWLAAPVTCVLLLTLLYWVNEGRYARKIETADIVGTWACVEQADCTFTFWADGTMTFKNVPVGLFDGSFGRDGSSAYAERHHGLWRPPLLNKTGYWKIGCPYVGDRIGLIEFDYPGGGAPTMNVDNVKEGLVLYFYIGDPDSNDTVGFFRK